MNRDKYEIINISSPKKIKKTFSFPIKNTYSKLSKKLEHNLNFQKSTENKFKKFYKFHIINSQLQKHNSTPNQKNIMIINDLIQTKTTHYLATFKDFLINDYIEEFMKRYFIMGESEELIPKFYLYYKNYLKFFCHGIFIDLKANKIIQDNGEFQAELYYNNNYGKKKKSNGKNKNKKNETSNKSSKTKNISDDKNNNFESELINKNKLIFSKSIRNKIGKIENDYIQENEISNIFYKNKNESITLNEETKIYNEDNIYTNENSLINLINILINKKIKRKKLNEKKIINKNNDKNFINSIKNSLRESPVKSSRYQNYIKGGLFNKTSKKISSIKIFNKNIPIILKNKNHNMSNNIKPPFLFKTKIPSRNSRSRNSKINFSNRANNSSNIFMKNIKCIKHNKKSKNNSKSLLSKMNIINCINNKTINNKYSTFNINIGDKKRKIINKCFSSKNTSGNSSNSSRNLKKNLAYVYQTSRLNNKNIKLNNNKINNYQYIAFKNKTVKKSKSKNKTFRHKQNWSLSGSNSIYNNFHININNNIMLLNNNSNINHYTSFKNNLKSNSKSKKKNNNYNTNNKKIFQNIKSRNSNSTDVKKYKTEIKNLQQNNIKNKKNISIKKYIFLLKSKIKEKDKGYKNKEQLIRTKSNLYYNNSCFKYKQIDESDLMPSLKYFKKLNINKKLNSKNSQKINIIFDYKKK